MKLSEAIREGIKKNGKQTFGYFWEFENQILTNEWDNYILGYDFKKNLTGCCTLGAAKLGINRPQATLNNVFHELTNLIDCPARDDWKQNQLSDIIIHLNDYHKWTREQIADWLESLGY